MLSRLLVSSVATTLLVVITPAGAAPATASSPRTSSDGAATPPVKRVVQAYGDGPVALEKGQQLVLRFRGRRGDRVALSHAFRVRTAHPVHSKGLPGSEVSLQGPGGNPEPDRSGYFRLSEDGWFTLRHRADFDQHVQLFKQVRLTHRDGSSTVLPQRRGHQYAVRVRAPRSGLRVVSFGAGLREVLSAGTHRAPEGEALLLAPGLPVLDSDPLHRLTKPLAPRQQVVVLVTPGDTGKVDSTVPVDAGRTVLDGPGVPLPGGGTGGVVVGLDSADLAASAQRMLHVKLVGARARREWSVLVLPDTRAVAKPSAAAYSVDPFRPVPLYLLDDGATGYRVVAFPRVQGATPASLELDSVADGGAIAVDGPAVTVPVRSDGRFTMLDVTAPSEHTPSYLTVSETTVAEPWAVHAGRLTLAHCPPMSSSGCGEGNSVHLNAAGTTTFPQYGGFLLTMPAADQTTGSFTVRLTSAPTGP